MSSAREWAILLLIAVRDGFCLFYDVKTKKVKGLNGSGRSPEKLNIDYVRRRGIAGPRIPSYDLNSVTVPGVFASVGGRRILTTNVRMCWYVGGYR